MTQRYIAKTEIMITVVGIWKSAEAIATQRIIMFHLDQVRGLMKSCLLNLELLILFQKYCFKIGYHDQQLI